MQTKLKINAKHDLNNYTMGAKHNQITKQFEVMKAHLPDLQKKLDIQKRKLSRLQKKPNDHSLEIFNLERNIEDLQKKINNIEHDNLKIEYEMKTMDKIFEYFDDNSDDCNKAQTYEDYLKILDPTCLINRNNIHSQDCENCHVKMCLNVPDGILICHNCGLTTEALIEDNKQSYNDGIIQQDNTYFSYKKITHFRECLEQCQGKERTDIPKTVFEQITDKLKEERIKSYKKLNVRKIKEILKELRLNRYYEHAPYILTKLTGKSPVNISQELENRLEKMFKDTQVAFKKCCPDGRKNFPSYNYVIHKFIQLIGDHDHLLEHFPLLKSPQKLLVMDSIWEDICDILKWEFHPSI